MKITYVAEMRVSSEIFKEMLILMEHVSYAFAY
jgi:hypothetical protein